MVGWPVIRLGPSHAPKNRGHKYMAVFYVYDANFIKGIPIKTEIRMSCYVPTKSSMIGAK